VARGYDLVGSGDHAGPLFGRRPNRERSIRALDLGVPVRTRRSSRVSHWRSLLVGVVVAITVSASFMISEPDRVRVATFTCGGSADPAWPDGGFEVAFQANTTNLWTSAPGGNADWQLGMLPGTSPAIAALPGGGFEVAFQANTANLWTVGTSGCRDWRLGMLPGTSPAIAALPGGGFEVAFQANTTNLWTVGSAGNTAWPLGMLPGTSPAIAALPGGGFEVAFQANTTNLWTVGSAGNTAWPLGMLPGTSPALAAPVAAPFASSISGINAALANRMRSSWRPGCPVPLSDLRYLTVNYRGFDGADHVGELVVAASVASSVVQVFRQLYTAGFPLASLRLVDDFGGSDDQSMAANNSSAFNCRPVTGGSRFSEHSYGTAIDLNPVQNPYLSGAVVLPEQGRAFTARPPAPGVILPGGAAVTAFARIGWTWGGTWTNPIDYMHFSVSGR